MIDWWNALEGSGRIFWGIAIAATVFQLLMFAGSIFATHDFDHSPDGGDGDATGGVKLLSIRAIVAFLVGFGWAGGLFLGRGHGVLASSMVAVGAGIIFMGIIFLIMRGLMNLKDDGTLDFKNAVGLHGQVYVTIPALRGGRGQVEILIQGRLQTLQAVTDFGVPLSPQTSIVVKEIEGGNLLVVSPV